ncbi:MAG: hypothetical protein U0869_07740 [Chloroflexota bacterium]
MRRATTGAKYLLGVLAVVATGAILVTAAGVAQAPPSSPTASPSTSSGSGPGILSDTLWAVIIGGALTLVATTGAEILRNRSAADREGAARREARQDRLDEIQRTNLLDLQEALQAWGRAIVKVIMTDRAIFTQTGHLTQLPENLNQEAFDTGVRFMWLTERVRDDSLRQVLEDVRALDSGIQARRAVYADEVTLLSIDADERALMDALSKAQQAVGTELRRYL